MPHTVRKERFEIVAGGRRLLAERLTPPAAAAGPVLVFLHEGLGSIGLWKDFPAALCRRLHRPGLVYDRWGYGGSEPLDRPRTARYLHDEAELFLPEVLTATGVERPVLIGHSDGGSIALLYAAAFPDRPAALVTEAAHVFVEPETLAGIRTAVEAFRTTDLKRRLARHHGDKTAGLFAAWADTWLAPGFASWNIEAALPHVTAPLLVLQGADDEYGTPAQVEAIARGVSGPVETHLLPACAHVPHHQARAAVLELTAGFLSRVLAQPDRHGP